MKLLLLKERKERMYKLEKNVPVARFFYKGHHSHPVRRTVLVTKSTENYLVGYELREGSEVRNFTNAPVKSYSRERIAKYRQTRGRKVAENKLNKSTLSRLPLLDLVVSGV